MCFCFRLGEVLVTGSESHPVRKFEGGLAESEGQPRDPLIGYLLPVKKTKKRITERSSKKKSVFCIQSKKTRGLKVDS